MLLLKIDKNLDKHRSNNEQDEHKDRDESSQQALLSNKGIADDSSDSPNIKISCRDSCCNVIKSVNTLTKGEANDKINN